MEGLCASCYSREHPLVRVPATITVVVCKRCGAVKVPRGWQVLDHSRMGPDGPLRQQVQVALGQHVTHLVPGVQLGVEFGRRLDRVLELTLTASGRPHPSLPPCREQHSLQVRFEYNTCTTCSMMSGGYHEAVLQIRADGRHLTEAEESEIATLVMDHLEAEYGRDTKAFISKVTRTRHGIDLLVGSEHLCRKIADDLESRYLAMRKENYKVIGQTRGGKDKYRITVLIRLQRFSVGDFVRVMGRPCQVLALGRGGLTCYDLQSHNSFTVSRRSAKWRTVEFIAPASAKRDYMVVSQSYGQPIQLMDMVTYETVELDDGPPLASVGVGAIVSALPLDGRLYVLPAGGP